VDRADRRRDGVRTDVPEHADRAAEGAGGRDHRGARVLRRARHQAEHAARVLVGLTAWDRVDASYVFGLESLDGSGREVESDFDQVYRAAGGSSGIDQVADLVGTEGDGQSGVDMLTRGFACVDVDAGGHVHGHDRHLVLDGEPHGRQSLPLESRTATDADDAVHDDIR
jgi:hypothetical protein